MKAAEKEVIKKEKLKDIANFINNFKEPDKTYFYLKYFINMESKEIAKKYNTTLSSVENRLYRCRLALKKIYRWRCIEWKIKIFMKLLMSL